MKETFEEIFEQRKESFYIGWKEFLRFKSISTDPNFYPECQSCAKWLANHLSNIGFEVSLLETSSLPVVYATYAGGKTSPRILYYGHYDVQPPDPLEDWESGPFEPQIRNGRMYARGAQDNKGQSWYVIKALEVLKSMGKLNCHVTLLLEGEEESASKGITASLPSWKDKVKADVLMVCDSGALRPGVPCVTMGLRGMVWLEVKLEGAKRDLHSGVFGGAVKNPAIELSRLLASLHDAEGKVAVEGFYNGVEEPPVRERELANKSWIGDELISQMIGVQPSGGEKNYTTPERRGFRPCLDVNGLVSGYTGPGSKTIIPALASAKLTARVVSGQDPNQILDCLEKHLKAHAPKDLSLSIVDKGVGGPGIALSLESKILTPAKKVLEALGGGRLDYMWEGASIPIVALLSEVSGATPLLVGFGLEEDRIHAPNESFSLEQFKLGFLYIGKMVEELCLG